MYSVTQYMVFIALWCYRRASPRTCDMNDGGDGGGFIVCTQMMMTVSAKLYCMCFATTMQTRDTLSHPHVGRMFMYTWYVHSTHTFENIVSAIYDIRCVHKHIHIYGWVCGVSMLLLLRAVWYDGYFAMGWFSSGGKEVCMSHRSVVHVHGWLVFKMLACDPSQYKILLWFWVSVVCEKGC